MIRVVSTPYGAFELKSRYQHNMMMGIGFSIAITSLILLSIWLYNMVTYEDMEIKEVIKVKTLVDLGPPLSMEIIRPKVEVKTPSKAAPKVGIPIPTDASELAEPDIVIVSKDDLRGIVTPSFGDNGGSDAGIVIEIPIEEVLPPDTFIWVEEPPELVFEELPIYPRLAQEGGFSGWVVLHAYVNKQGEVKKAKAVKTNRSGMGFEEAAIKAAYKCKYRPAIQSGAPVGVWIAYKVEFKI